MRKGGVDKILGAFISKHIIMDQIKSCNKNKHYTTSLLKWAFLAT